MKNLLIFTNLLFVAASSLFSETMTYNRMETINLRDSGIPADERSTAILAASGNSIYGATSGDACHFFRFEPGSKRLEVLASVDGPNTVEKGLALDGDNLYAGVMLSKKQLWLEGRKRGGSYEPEDANLYRIDDSWNTGHLYRITGINGDSPGIEDLGIPVQGQGIHTLTIDRKRRLLYGLTSPSGTFFIYNLRTHTTETIDFGTTWSKVSNNTVNFVEIPLDLTDFTPGEVEFNNKLVSNAMHVMEDGTLYTSGWRGMIIRYDPAVPNPRERFSSLGYLPSVAGRQHWNRIDSITERDGKLYLGTSDGYILRLDPTTGEVANYGKPVSANEVMGMTFSPADGGLYGVNGGRKDGICRFWRLDTWDGTFKVDLRVFERPGNWRPIGGVTCTDDGTLVMAERSRVGNLRVFTPATPKEWGKSGVIPDFKPQENPRNNEAGDVFSGHTQFEVTAYPIPSAMHGGTGYTAIQTDTAGMVYVGGAYYGKYAPLMQLDPRTAYWRMIFRSDELTHQFGRGMGIPAKIHTKLRLGSDGKIYGAMKQGYETQYHTRSEIGEAPEGSFGSQFTSHLFSYDPVTDTASDLGPGYKQEGFMGFHADVERGFLYGVTGPTLHFIVYDLKTGRIWDAGDIGGTSPARYMALDYDTGRVYHWGERTHAGKHYMTVWDPEDFRLRDIEIVAEDGLGYSHPYAYCCGPVGSNSLYGGADGKLFEMNLDTSGDGMLHVRSVCTVYVDGEPHHGEMKAITLGPDNRIYWVNSYNRIKGLTPVPIFTWDPASRKKTYIGSCSSGGDWFRGMNQGMCIDRSGNLYLQMIHTHITPAQQKRWKVPDDFSYVHTPERYYYTGYPPFDANAFYAVFRAENVTSIR